MPYSGGYYLTTNELIRRSMHGHTAALDRPFSDTALEALNAIQATPWRINRFVLDVMREAWTAGDLLGDLPSAVEQPLPPRMDDAAWSALSPEDQQLRKAERSDIHAANASAESGRISFLDKLLVSEELRDREAIWFPHSLDFRGRIYPEASKGPNPQSDSLGRSLLMFADGKPLGTDGMFWLMVRAAGCYGEDSRVTPSIQLDKLPLEDRVKWVQANLAQISDSAMNPLDGDRFWAATEEDPWGFLATCHEIHQALSLEDPTTFVSHLPVPLDGTCNGLQHLSAMGRDPVGASATNLRDDPVRRDIYVEVANAVIALVNVDALNGDETALSWVNKVSRKVVKRAVMTTPYGVTSMGIRGQLIADGHVDGDRSLRGKRATYLRDKIVQAVAQTVGAAKEIMAWLQEVAVELAKHNVPFEFVTPTGSRICQSYYVLARNPVRTLFGDLILWEENPRGGLDARKQALAAAPNFIHAFDAAHLSATVLMGRRLGIDSWAMIHDSYGTHAADTTQLNAALRETFVRQYADKDWLADVEAEAMKMCPTAVLPPRPARGDFDVTEVRRSPFFFS